MAHVNDYTERDEVEDNIQAMKQDTITHLVHVAMSLLYYVERMPDYSRPDESWLQPARDAIEAAKKL